MTRRQVACVRAEQLAGLERFQEKWKRFSGSQTRQDKDLQPFGDSVEP